MRGTVALRRGALAGLVVVAALAAGCGASSPSASGTSSGHHATTTTRPQSLKDRYRTIVSGGDHKLQQLSTTLNKANGDVKAIQSGFRAVATTYRQVATQVGALPFPAHMRADVKAMTAALDTLAADATAGAGSASSAQFDAVFTKLAADQKAEVAANTTVNHDLGISAIH